MSLDSTHLLNQIKIKATLPPGRYEDDEILDIAHDVMLSQVVPLILSLKEEFYVRAESQAITQDVASYEIPYRAFGLALREVKRVDGSNIIDLWRISPTDVTTTTTGTPTSFYLEAQDVVLHPTPASTQGSVKLSYYLTPSRPVLLTEVAAITAIDTITGIVTASAPSAWTTANNFDLVSQRNGHKTLAFDLTASNVTTSILTFTAADLPSTLAIGDYIVLAGEAPYLQVPDAAFGLAVQLIANELLEDLGDQAAIAIGQQKAEMLKANLSSALSVRVTGAPKRSRIRI